MDNAKLHDHILDNIPIFIFKFKNEDVVESSGHWTRKKFIYYSIGEYMETEGVLESTESSSI